MSEFFRNPDDDDLRELFKNGIQKTDIDTLTQHELVEVHICLSYLKTMQKSGLLRELQAKDEQIFAKLDPFNEQEIMDYLSNIYNCLKGMPYGSIDNDHLEGYYNVMDQFLDLFAIVNVIQADAQLLPKFQVHEIFEMLSDQGHTSWKADHGNNRFWGKFSVVQHVYQVPEIAEFMAKLRGCIRDEAIRKESCYSIIVPGRMEYLDDENEASGAKTLRRNLLADTQEIVYNTIAHYSEEDIEAIPRDPTFAAELLITECVLRDRKGENGAVNELQHEQKVIENKKQMKGRLSDCPKLSKLDFITIQACGIKASFKKTSTTIEQRNGSIKYLLQEVWKLVYAKDKQIYVPEYLQYLILELSTDKHIEQLSGPYKIILDEFRETQEILRRNRSNLQDIEQFNEFVRNTIEALFESEESSEFQEASNHKTQATRSDVVALKALYITLAGINRTFNRISTKTVLSIGNRKDIQSVSHAIRSEDANYFNLQNDFRTRQLVGFMDTEEVVDELQFINSFAHAEKNLMKLSAEILKLKNIEKMRDTDSNWISLQTIVLDLISSHVHIPISLQFGLVSLEPHVPDSARELLKIIQKCEDNVGVRLNIRKWFEQNNEISSTIRRKTAEFLASQGDLREIAKTLYLLTSSLDLPEIIENQLSFTDLILLKWAIEQSNKSTTLFSSDIVKLLTQNDDFHENLKAISDRVVTILSAGDSKEINFQLKYRDIYAYANKEMRQSIAKSYDYQNEVMKLVLNITVDETQRASLLQELSTLLNSERNKSYLAPSIVCGINSINGKHPEFNLNRAMDSHFKQICNSFATLMSDQEHAKDSKPETSLLEKSIADLYASTNMAQLQNAATTCYTYLSNYHSLRKHLSREFQIHVRIALYSLRRVLPGDVSTIDWLQFAAIRHRDLRLQTLKEILTDYTEIDRFSKLTEQSGNKSELCTKWLMYLLVGHFVKSEMSSDEAFDKVIRSTQYPYKMVQIDNKLNTHCEDHGIINELRSELNYRQALDRPDGSPKSDTDSNAQSRQLSPKVRAPEPLRLITYPSSSPPPLRSPVRRDRAKKASPQPAAPAAVLPHQTTANDEPCDWPCVSNIPKVRTLASEPAQEDAMYRLIHSPVETSEWIAEPNSSSIESTKPAIKQSAPRSISLFAAARLKPRTPEEAQLLYKSEPKTDHLFKAIPAVPFKYRRNNSSSAPKFTQGPAVLVSSTTEPVIPKPTPEVLQKMRDSNEFTGEFVESFRFLTYDKLLERYPDDCRQLITFCENHNFIPKPKPKDAKAEDPALTAKKERVEKIARSSCTPEFILDYDDPNIPLSVIQQRHPADVAKVTRILQKHELQVSDFFPANRMH